MRKFINIVEAAQRSYPIAPRDEWYSNMNYAEYGGEIIMMTPDEFLSKVRPLVMDEISRDNIDDLKNHILSGRTLDPLVIYADGKEDGRHRANAAKELGIRKVPVIVFSSQNIDEARNPKEIKRFSQSFDDTSIDIDKYNQSALRDTGWKRTLIQYMGEHDFHLIGAGINGAVFRNPKYPYVLKVFRTDQGYMEWVNFAKAHQDNPYVPKIKGNAVRLNSVFTAVRIEDLEVCPIEKAYELINDIKMFSSILLQNPEQEESLKHENEDVLAIAKFIDSWFSYVDLNHHNVMQRKNGFPVIIDPLYITDLEE